MSKSYKIKEKVPEKVGRDFGNMDSLTKQLLYNRGITTKDSADKFLNPDFENQLLNPFLLPDMEKAVDRILYAIDKDEMIGIWSDYDADGIPGGALLHDFFKLINFNNFINYIPDRIVEGYGLNLDGVKELKEAGVKLLITVDCGIRDTKEITLANSLGMETIITDHHEPALASDMKKEILPPAFAIVNHKLKNSKYPESVLCGSGIAWKLIEGILKKRRNILGLGQEKWLLDLAGIATLSDMVPLTGENRAIAHFGLKVLQKTKRPGLRKLYSILRINPRFITEDDVGFSISPRINAASRMGKPRDAFDLLVAANEEEAGIKANHLDKINNERKGVVASIVKEAKKMVKTKHENHGEKSVIVLGSPLWRPSLLGLAANSIADEYRRPVFLWGREGGETIKGSCRSDGSTDLVGIMERAKSHFIEFGGHKFSGGFSVEFDKIPTLEDALIEASTHSMQGDEEIWVDTEMKIKDVHEDNAKEMNRLAPFGVGNEKPLLVFNDIIPEKISRFGKSEEHISIILRDGSHTAKAIGFFIPADKFGDKLKEGIATNLVATMELSYFNSYRPETRLRIVDFF